MPEVKAPDGKTRVGYLELTAEEKARVERDHKVVKSVLVQGFKDDPELKDALRPSIREEIEQWAGETDPRTRPGSSRAGEVVPDTVEVDIKRFSGMKRAVVDKGTGKQVRLADAQTTWAQKLPADQTWGHIEGGWLPPMQKTADERDEVAKEFADIIGSDEKTFNVLKFPRGDIDNFSICRWAMALERSQNTAEADTAFRKHAPWESAYYAALERYNETKAQGDMVSGQDGGFLAPELWSTQFIDQIYPASATGRLPLTRIPMGTRVVHVPRLSANLFVQYSSESAALVATQAQFQQVSFTARKQYVFVQISNELIRDSNPAAMTILQGNAAKYMAFDQDFQILLGSGLAGAPVGLYNQVNVTKAVGANGSGFSGTNNTFVGTNSNYPKLSDILGAIYNVEDLNGSANIPLGQAQVSGIVGPVALKHHVTAITDQVEGAGATASARPLYDFGINQMRWANRMDGASSLDGLFGVDTWVLTNVIKKTLVAGSGSGAAAPTSTNNLTSPNPLAAANMNPVFFGDWQHLWVMERQDIELLASNVAGTAFQNDQTWIRLIRRYDVGVAHPEPFYVVTNA